MKIYTKSGDKGTTSLVYGERISKADIRVEAYGTCDEANSFIGLALSEMTFPRFQEGRKIRKALKKIQTDIFHVGAELSTPIGKEVKWKINSNSVDFLERTIDEWESKLPKLKTFILPGGTRTGATLHVARTIIRRAERKVVELGEDVNPIVLRYLNRLSDFLFVAARYINYLSETPELILHDEKE